MEIAFTDGSKVDWSPLMKSVNLSFFLVAMVSSVVNGVAYAEATIPNTQWVNLQSAPFSILKNNSTGVEIVVGKMPLPRSASGPVGTHPYSYSVTSPTGKAIVQDALFPTDFKISVGPNALPETGAYNVEVKCIFGELDGENRYIQPELYECWSQDVFIYSVSARKRIGALKFDTIARNFAPVLSFAPQEQYLPASLGFIFNTVNSNNQMANHRVKIRDVARNSCCGFEKTYRFSELLAAVKGQGNSNFLIDMGYEGSISFTGPSEMSVRFGDGKTNDQQRANVVVYYSVIPSRTQDNIFYLNYHFLYAYDSKGGDAIGHSGSTGVAAHAFDRESVTLKLQANGNNIAPVSVVYGAHLPDQTLALLEDDDVKFSWEGGALVVPWSEASKITGTDHPIVSIARGSHAVYPRQGTYAVLMDNIKMLTEEAGGGDVVLPPALSDIGLSAEFKATNSLAQKNYQLRDLEIMDLNPKSETSVLTFSGYWVTILFGKADAKFPPFTNRETDPDQYSRSAAKWVP